MITIDGLPSRYRVEDLLGEGGFGKVFRVFDRLAQRPIALKILSVDAAAIRASLMREFKVLAELQHPNLVRVHDFGYITNKLFYFTMELLSGVDLRAHLSEGRNISDISLIIEQILSALKYLHENGIVHGDIKPQNIMITRDASSIVIKLLDFGLASSTRGSRGRLVSGTPRFLAPEILRDGASKDRSSDMFALGASLVESIEGSDFPSPLELGEDLLKEHYSRVNRILSSGGLKNPSATASFIFDLCCPDREMRPQSAIAALCSFNLILAAAQQERKPQTKDIFIGREHEIERVLEFLSFREAGKRMLLVRGARGTGKKTIVRKASQGAQLKRNLIIDLSSVSHERFSRDWLIERISSQLRPSEREILLSRASRIRSTVRAMKREADLASLPQRSLVLFNYIIEALSEIGSASQLVVVFPDIDSLNEDYLIFLNQVINYIDVLGAPFKLVSTLNTDCKLTHRARGIIDILERSDKAEILDVGAFDLGLLERYLEAAFGKNILHDFESRKLLESTGGIPLLIEAALRNLMAEKVIRLKRGEWVFDHVLFAKSEIPKTGENALSAFVSELDENQKTVLRLLAFLDIEVTLKQFYLIASPLIPSCSSAVQSLIDSRLLNEAPSGTIQFSHPSYRQIVIEICSRSQRRLLNKHLAEYLSSNAPDRALSIARHYTNAEELQSAMAYIPKIIEEQYSKYQPRDCLRLLLDMRSLASRKRSKEDFFRICTYLAPVQEQVGLLKDALESYNLLSSTATSQEERIRYSIKRGDIYDILGNSRKSRAIWLQALKSARRLRQDELRAEILMRLAEIGKTNLIHHLKEAIKLSRNRYPHIYISALTKLFDIYKTSRNVRELSKMQQELTNLLPHANEFEKKQIYISLARRSFLMGEYGNCLKLLHEKVAIEKKQGDFIGLTNSLMLFAGNYYVKGQISKLIKILQEIYNTSIAIDAISYFAVNANNLVLAYRNIADYGLALKTIEENEKIFRLRKMSQFGSLVLIKPVQVYVQLGRSKEREFRTLASKLYRVAKERNNAVSLGHYNICYSTYHWINLRYKMALSCAEKAEVLFRKVEDRDDTALSLIQKGILLTSLGELSKAKKALAEANSICENIHCEYLRPFLLLGRGMHARCSGNPDAAKILSQGLSVSKRIGTREITWQIQRELALHYLDRGQHRDAVRYFEHALEMLKQITETMDDKALQLSYLEVPIRKRLFDEIAKLKNSINSDVPP